MSESNTNIETITINGVQYVRADTLSASVDLSGDRVVVVADRGFVYAGNMARQEDGSIVLRDALNVRRWAKGGVGGLLSDPVAAEAILDSVAYPIEFPAGTVLQIVRVPETWGRA